MSNSCAPNKRDREALAEVLPFIMPSDNATEMIADKLGVEMERVTFRTTGIRTFQFEEDKITLGGFEVVFKKDRDPMGPHFDITQFCEDAAETVDTDALLMDPDYILDSNYNRFDADGERLDY